MSTNSKIPNGPRRKMGASRHRKPSRRWTAHHEAAHAVASIRLGQDMTGRFATIKAHGKTLGVVSSEDPLCTSRIA
jgi:ATP-dependent Zn protease